MDFNNFIIFLDVDGVLVSYDTLKVYENDKKHSFKPEAIGSLNNIIKYYNADLCMISSWNSKFGDDEQYKEFLISRGIKVNNLTRLDHCNRSGEILKLIDEGLKYYLIIDDESYEYIINIPKIEYKRILTPNRFRCLDKYDFKNVTFNWKLNV
jgi:histidinol phosphatase-like PHP family hydrolase